METRAIIYCRTAHDDSISLEMQKAQLTLFAERKGWHVISVIAEHGSGMTRNRPRLAQLMAAIENGDIDIVLAKNPSRLCRKTSDIEECLLMMEQHATRLYSVDMDVEVKRQPIYLTLLQQTAFARP